MGRLQEELTLTTLHPVQQLRAHHKSMVRAYVAGAMRPGELAVAFGLTESSVSRIIQSPLFRAEVERLEAALEEQAIDARAELVALQGASIAVLSDNLHRTDIDRRIKTQSALEVLDRTGYGKTVNVNTNVTHLTSEDIFELQARADQERAEYQERLRRRIAARRASEENDNVQEADFADVPDSRVAADAV